MRWVAWRLLIFPKRDAIIGPLPHGIQEGEGHEKALLMVRRAEYLARKIVKPYI
jgi:hypothetical protein